MDRLGGRKREMPDWQRGRTSGGLVHPPRNSRHPAAAPASETQAGDTQSPPDPNSHWAKVKKSRSPGVC